MSQFRAAAPRFPALASPLVSAFLSSLRDLRVLPSAVLDADAPPEAAFYHPLPMPPLWLYPIIAFFCGSIPTGLLIGKAKGIDIRQHGSKNIGATNIGRVLGTKFFFLCFAIDLLKGLLPVAAAGYLLGALGKFDLLPAQTAWWLGTMIAAVLGNVFNPWLKFKGGKGVATSLGVLIGVFPALSIPGMAAFALWGATLAIWRYISIASLAAAAALPIFVIAQWAVARGLGYVTDFSAGWPYVGVASLLTVLVYWTHRANIGRLRAGTEPKMGRRR